MKRDKASLLDIVNAAKRVQQFAEGFDQSALVTNEEKQSAILYQIIVMGEAAKRLSSDFRARHPVVFHTVFAKIPAGKLISSNLISIKDTHRDC